jgi:hypothetical protein
LPLNQQGSDTKLRGTASGYEPSRAAADNYEIIM